MNIETARAEFKLLQRQVRRIEEVIGEYERATTHEDHCFAATKLYRSTTDAEAQIECIRRALSTPNERPAFRGDAGQPGPVPTIVTRSKGLPY